MWGGEPMSTLHAVSGMLFVVLMVALAVVIIVALIQVWRAKIVADKDSRYQQMAAAAEELARRIASDQQKISEELAALKNSVNQIENMLREVE
ncbi:MAG: hypothetical protein A6D91_03535 [Bacillaceae bacterium G1]|nr:MAG: hypothetical protein A6D91_03535 [Bacillaceae bacterium G1]